VRVQVERTPVPSSRTTVSCAAPGFRDGTAVGCGALTVAVAVSHGIGGDPAREGRTGAAEAFVAFVAGAEPDGDAELEAVVAGVDVVLGVAEATGEAVVAEADDEADDEVDDVPESLEQPARAARSTSAMPAPPRRAPMRERTAVTAERLPRALAVYRDSELPFPRRN
jgi:hypothetical protein